MRTVLVVSLIVLALCGAVDAQMVSNTGTTGEDSITMYISCLDSLGNISTCDSFYVRVFKSNANAVIFSDSGICATMTTIDSAVGKSHYYYHNSVANIDGAGVVGNYELVVIARKCLSYGSTWGTPNRKSFQIMRYPPSYAWDSAGLGARAAKIVQDSIQVWDAAGGPTYNLSNASGSVTAIKTKTDYLPSVTAGGAGGVFIAGTNAATNVTTAFSSGGVAVSTLTAADNIGINWADVAAPTTTLGLTGTTIGTVTTTTTATNLTNAPTNGDLTATMKSSVTAAVPTAAANATAVWTDATAGDFDDASSIGKSLYTSGNAPGAASGLAIVGSNMGSATSVSGAVGSVSAAVTVTGTPAVNVTQWNAHAVADSANGFPDVNVKYLGGRLVTSAGAVSVPTSIGTGTSTLTASDNIGINLSDVSGTLDSGEVGEGTFQQIAKRVLADSSKRLTLDGSGYVTYSNTAPPTIAQIEAGVYAKTFTTADTTLRIKLIDGTGANPDTVLTRTAAGSTPPTVKEIEAGMYAKMFTTSDTTLRIKLIDGTGANPDTVLTRTAAGGTPPTAKEVASEVKASLIATDTTHKFQFTTNGDSVRVIDPVRTVAATVSGGALETSVTKVRDSVSSQLNATVGSRAAETSVTKVRDSVSAQLDAKISTRGTSTLTTSDNIGINWNDVDNKTATVALTNTTVGAVTAATVADLTAARLAKIDSISFVDSVLTLMMPKITEARDSLQTVSTWLTARLDSALYASGFKAGAKTITGSDADCDTLHVYIGASEWFKMLFYHPGGTAGAAPDSTKTVVP